MFGRDEKVSAIRLTAAQYLILAIFLVLAYGLWRLQVMQSDYYSLAAEKNRIRNVPVLAPRGKILDRYGRTIVDSLALTGEIHDIGFTGTLPAPVPEPASWAMMIAGFGLAGFALRRQRVGRALHA